MYSLKSLAYDLENIEHDNKIERKLKSLDYNNVIMAIKDYLYYGYSFNDFIQADYSYCERFTNEELKKIWNNVKNIMGDI